jgi:two-component system response regulator PhoP
VRLLLVEDDAALRLGLARRLEADGFRVDQAADGEDGLFQAREYPVDLAIVDLRCLDGDTLLALRVPARSAAVPRLQTMVREPLV